MPPNMIVGPAIDDPAEQAYLHHRKVVRRRQLALILAILALTCGFVGWKAARHLSTAWWLQTNHYAVDWSIDQENWRQGGSTSIRYSPGFYQGFTSNALIRDLKFLSNLQHLEDLDLASLPSLRDSDLTILSDLSGLRRLNLARFRPPGNFAEPVRLTDATLARIGQLPLLEVLILDGQKITDAGLTNLAALTHLQELDLAETELTDAGLEQLQALPSLKLLNLQRTKVTAEGLARFEAARPLVKVLADPMPIPTPKPKR